MKYMDRHAPVDYPVHDLITRRWSPVAFTERPCTENDIHLLLEAMRWAPSSYNEQPWRLIYALKDDGKKRDTLESLLNEGNAWAKAAPFLGLIVAKKTFTKNGKPNRHHLFDCGSAMENLFLQATTLGLQGHGMAGFDADKARKEYKIEKDYEPITMIAVGEHDGSQDRDPALKEREEGERTRKAQSEFAFKGEWKNG